MVRYNANRYPHRHKSIIYFPFLSLSFSIFHAHLIAMYVFANLCIWLFNKTNFHHQIGFQSFENCQQVYEYKTFLLLNFYTFISVRTRLMSNRKLLWNFTAKRRSKTYNLLRLITDRGFPRRSIKGDQDDIKKDTDNGGEINFLFEGNDKWTKIWKSDMNFRLLFAHYLVLQFQM